MLQEVKSMLQETINGASNFFFEIRDENKSINLLIYINWFVILT